MKTKTIIQPWQLAKMRSHKIAGISHPAKKKEFVIQLGRRWGNLIEDGDTSKHSGLDFANIIADFADFKKDASVFTDCAFCVQSIKEVWKDENNDLHIVFKKK